MNKLIVGLGNPGKKYQNTRHNIGMAVIDGMSLLDGCVWKEKFKGFYTSYQSGGDKFYFLKPQTYMNLSGESVLALIQFFKVEIQDVLVIHDELDLPYGTLAFKKGGGLAGHNGLKSIAECTGQKDFLRLRMGIGRPVHGSASSWVLSGYGKDEEMLLDDYLKAASEAMELYIKNGFGKDATNYSRKQVLNIKE